MGSEQIRHKNVKINAFICWIEKTSLEEFGEAHTIYQIIFWFLLPLTLMMKYIGATQMIEALCMWSA